MTNSTPSPDPPKEQGSVGVTRQCDCGRTFETEAVVVPDSGLGKEFRFPKRRECPECYGRREREEAERLWRQALWEHETKWEVLCPLKYRMFDSALYPQAQLANHDKVYAWQYGERGLLLAGRSRQGKTHAVYHLLRRLYDEGRTIVTFDCIGFVHDCIRYTSNNDLANEFAKWIARVYTADVVLFDDMDKMRMSDRVELELFAAVERRTANGLPVFVTMNAAREQFLGMLSEDRGEPLVCRLNEFCEVITF